jgi:hypothetical protein
MTWAIDELTEGLDALTSVNRPSSFVVTFEARIFPQEIDGK